MKEVILTGIRSNDEPTLGNYLGAFLPMVQLQREKAGDYQVNMFVPDLHSFTTPIDHENLYSNTIKNLKYFVAAGLDIENTDTFIYRQSYVSAHSELTWILDCFANMGEIARMTQFKEKSKQSHDEMLKNSELLKSLKEINAAVKLSGSPLAEVLSKRVTASEELAKISNILRDLDKESVAEQLESINKKFRIERIQQLEKQIELYDKLENATVGTLSSVGLFNYPVLMAADILLYGARWVPVGDDQKQHLEITRDIAQRMNTKFGDIFTVPHEWKKQLEFSHRDNGVRIRSLTNPEKKMSKSVSDPRGTILLSDSPADAAKKVMSATTDSIGKVHFDWDNQPGITNLLQMLALLTGTPQKDVNETWEDTERYGDLKKAVADAVENFLTDFQARYQAVDEAKLLLKLESDEAAMREVAGRILYGVQQAVGLRPKS